MIRAHCAFSLDTVFSIFTGIANPPISSILHLHAWLPEIKVGNSPHPLPVDICHYCDIVHPKDNEIECIPRSHSSLLWDKEVSGEEAILDLFERFHTVVCKV